MPPEIGSLLPVMSIIITLCAVVGGAIAFRGNQGKGANEIQQSTIMAQQAQLDTQDKQIKTLEKKLTHLNRVVLTIEYALKRRGLRIEIDDEAIMLIDERARSNQTVHIRLMDAMPTEDKDA